MDLHSILIWLNFPKNIEHLRDVWDEACENVSDNAIQAAFKRAYSVDEYNETKLGQPPHDPRLEIWGNQFPSQPLDEVYKDYPVNISSDGEEDSDFWDE